MRPMMRFLPLALTAALLAAGCGSGGSTETTTSGGPETTEAHQSGAGGPAGITARACRHTGKEAMLLRVTGVSCSKGKTIAAGWRAKSGCAPGTNESRSACTVDGFRCLTSSVGQGLAVTCARPGHSIAFIAKG